MTSSLNSAETLLNFITEIEKATSEKDLINEHIRSIYSMAQSCGYDKKAIREVVKLRKLDPYICTDFENSRELYKSIAGM